MIKKIVSFSVYHPVSVLMLHLALLLCCCIALYTVQLDFMPKMNERFLLISSDFTGVSAQDMRKLVTIPVEDAAASLKGIKNISSVTRDGLSLVIVELHWNVDADIAIVECRQIIDQCYEALPNGCAKPNVAFFNPVHRETLTLVIFPNDNDLEYGRHIVDTDIRPHLQRVKGVGSVSVTGGEKPEVKVVLDKAKLESIPVSLQSVAEILSQANFEYPSGSVSDGGKELLFRTSGLFTTLGDIEDVPFLYGSGGGWLAVPIDALDDGVNVYGRTRRAHPVRALLRNPLGCLRPVAIEVLHRKTPGLTCLLDLRHHSVAHRSRTEDTRCRLGVADRRGEADASGPHAGHAREPLDQTERLRPTIAAQQRVHLVHHDEAQVPKELGNGRVAVK